MGGQSNMVGKGKLVDLEPDFFENVVYYNFGYNTNLSLSTETFGPEIGLSKILKDSCCNDKFILIKYAINGASMWNWSPVYDENKAELTDHPEFGNMYEVFKDLEYEITNKLDAEIVALCWMQGEGDARIDSAAHEYYDNFRMLINSVRKDFESPDLPIIYGMINPPKLKYPMVDYVRSMQMKIDTSISNTFIIETDDLMKNEDKIHYSSGGQLVLGERFGEQILSILKY